MQVVNIHKAKTELSKLIKMALEGEEIVIAKAGKPLVHLLPYKAPSKKRKPGRYKKKIWMAPDFNETPDEIIKGFEGRE
jgi:prevent-host-death family protein